MNFTLFRRDVPVGTVNLMFDEDQELGGGTLEFLPGVEEFQSIIREALLVTSNFGYMPPPGAYAGGVNAEGEAAGTAAIERMIQLESELSLVDDGGRVLGCTSISLLGIERVNEPMDVIVSVWDPVA